MSGAPCETGRCGVAQEGGAELKCAWLGQDLGEQVCHHLCRWDERQLDLPVVHELPDIMMADVNVAHPRGAAARHGDGRLVVAVDSGGRVQWLVQQLLLQLAQEH